MEWIPSAEILNDEDLEDGEIFEDEEPGEVKKTTPAPTPDKPKLDESAAPAKVELPAAKKQDDTVKNHRVFESDKPSREQNVPFFNKGKRRHFDDDEDNRWKRDGKRNRKSHDFERDGDNNRGRHDGEIGEDDEEMMLVRGASPHRLDEDLERWDREAEEEDARRASRSYSRGRGNMGRRGDRPRGRGRGGRGSMRGNKRKREDSEVCMFWRQGKCHRGTECPYAHDIIPPRKPELCKFYMKDCCAKKDKCLYMHSEFPCKYYHTGLKCYANKKCKFSHSQLNDSLRNILAKHLDSAPKDILGEYPRRDRGDPRDLRDQRDTRGDPRDMRDMRGDFLRNKMDRDRKIPSLFDIKVNIPEELKNSDGNHTPMPSPTQRSQDSNRSNEHNREYSPDRDRDRERERERERDKEREHEKHKHEKAERSKERKAKREKAREHRKERKEKREREKEKKRERSKDVSSEKNDLSKHVDNNEIMSPNQPEDKLNISSEIPMPVEKMTEESVVERRSDDGLFPQHLPKKQRELFLRIQQQQREADNSQASANDDDDENDKAAEENWYSSDEETSASTSLPSILQGLAQSTNTTSLNTTTTTTTDTVMPLLNLLANASAAAKPLTVNSNTAPAPTPFIPPNLDLANLSTVFEALTNLQKMNSANKQSNQQPQIQTTTATTLDRAESITEIPKPDPPKPEPPRVRDPRLRTDIGIIENRRGSKENLDVDLRLKPTTMVKSQPQTSDVDLRSLPFKPVEHSAASEIDASLASHSPLHWQLIPTEIVKADYSSLQLQPKPGVNDPRLRRILRPPTDELGLPRDPRQRLIDEPVRDPRARQPLLATPNMPPTPRYDEDIRPQFYHMDSDMRQFPPPTPRSEDEVYSPGPSRPVDPRQRSLSFEDPRRKPQFPGRPDDIDLRHPITHRVPFVNFK